MTGGDVALTLLTGLAGASSLFLVAAGLTVIFGVTRVVNFSHGSLAMLGAYLGWSIITALPRSPAGFVLGVLLSTLAVAAIGAAIEILVLRRIYSAPALFQLLATFGLVLIVSDVVLHVWGPEDLALSRPAWLRGALRLGDVRFPAYDLALIAVPPLVLVSLQALLHRTGWGVKVRAATLDREMVGALGVDQRGLFTSVFALGAGLAGLAGALSLPDASATLGMDLSIITESFVVVVVGGLGSVGGAYLAALLIGVLQAFGIALVPQGTLVLAFVVMACVLAVRPNGLLGRAQAEARTLGAATLVLPAPVALRVVAAVVLLGLAGLPIVAGPYVVSVATEAVILVLFASGLHLMMGPGGMPSFGHALFFGIGAYAAALLLRAGGLAMSPALLAAALAGGAAGLVFGLVVIRLSGVYLAMLTLALAQIAWAGSVQFVALTGGDNGVLGVWPAAWARDPAAFYWLCLVISAGGVLLLRRAIYAPFGYALRGVRDDRARAEAIGLRPRVLGAVAIVLSGAAAGLAGGLYAFAKGSVFPSALGLSRSVDGLLMVLLGGVQTVSGPVVGGLAYVGLYDGLQRAAGDWWRSVLGLAIIAMVLLFPEGIAGAAQRAWRRG